MGGGMPPMQPLDNMNFEMGDEISPMRTEQGGDSEMPSSFDTNFDAGVEADEETDPKKYIQQLTGKLSQTLNTYNNENGEPDTELGKYVLGMLIKQGTKGMDGKEKKELIKKINTDNDSLNDEMPDENVKPEDENQDGMNGEEIQKESKVIKCTKKQIFEGFGLTTSDEISNHQKKESDAKIAKDTLRNRKTRPFEAPKKFKE